ncbi:MAG: DinB family protein [Pyrinomonadaceae bacterium]
MQSTSTKMTSILAAEYSRELEAEARASRECLANVPFDKPDWKPHDRSMPLGYLSELIADMPRWIQKIIDDGVIDFATYDQFKAKSVEELTTHFDNCVENAHRSISTLTDEGLEKEFILRNKDQILMTTPVGETISSTINHMVHHRGQLTVYLRLNGKEVPSIYGPSADTGGF